MNDPSGFARNVGMNELTNHYRMMLGLDETWLEKSLVLSLESKRVVIAVEHSQGRLDCPNGVHSEHEWI